MRQRPSRKAHNLGDGIFGFSASSLDILHINPQSKYKVLDFKPSPGKAVLLNPLVTADREQTGSVWKNNQ